MKKTIMRHIKGYTIGSSVFVIFVPFLIYNISKIKYPLFQIPIFHSYLIKNIICMLLFIIGFIFAIWPNIGLFKIGKGGPTDFFNIDISPRSKKLVITGPYRYTRNPMVFGMNSIYLSIALYLNSLSSLLFVILFLPVIIIYLKLTEEKRLLKDFGDEYLEYKKKVSMIIPLPPKQA